MKVVLLLCLSAYLCTHAFAKKQCQEDNILRCLRDSQAGSTFCSSFLSITPVTVTTTVETNTVTSTIVTTTTTTSLLYGEQRRRLGRRQGAVTTVTDGDSVMAYVVGKMIARDVPANPTPPCLSQVQTAAVARITSACQCLSLTTPTITQSVTSTTATTTFTTTTTTTSVPCAPSGGPCPNCNPFLCCGGFCLCSSAGVPISTCLQ